MTLTHELIHFLHQSGASLVGIGDMKDIEGSAYPCGVAVAIPLPPTVVEDLKTAPTPEYYALYTVINKKLDAIVTAGATFLTDKGYHALGRTKAVAVIDKNNCTTLPHKTVATRAGLGWIGKSALLVTPQYGSALRISSLLTDAPLQTTAPVTTSRCGTCERCVQSCPANALTGTLWQAGLPRKDLVDVDICCQKMFQITKEVLGEEIDICGKCIAVCPYTQAYLNSCQKNTVKL